VQANHDNLWDFSQLDIGGIPHAQTFSAAKNQIAWQTNNTVIGLTITGATIG